MFHLSLEEFCFLPTKGPRNRDLYRAETKTKRIGSPWNREAAKPEKPRWGLVLFGFDQLSTSRSMGKTKPNRIGSPWRREAAKPRKPRWARSFENSFWKQNSETAEACAMADFPLQGEALFRVRGSKIKGHALPAATKTMNPSS